MLRRLSKWHHIVTVIARAVMVPPAVMVAPSVVPGLDPGVPRGTVLVGMPGGSRPGRT
jgi:hypothetical protein